MSGADTTNPAEVEPTMLSSISSLLSLASSSLVDVGDWVVWMSKNGADYGQLDSTGRIFFHHCKASVAVDAELLSECVSFLDAEWHKAANLCNTLRA